LTTINCVPFIELEETWNQFIDTQKVPEESSQLDLSPLKMEINARKNKRIVLESQDLLDLKAHNYNLISAANQVIKDVATLLESDMYVALVEENGYTLVTHNLTEGVQWPGMRVKNDRILQARQEKTLMSLKNNVDSPYCPAGYYYSICLSIFNYENKCVGALAIGSFHNPLPYELMVSVYLGANLIERRYNHLQLLKHYSYHILDKLPQCALVLNDAGYIEKANQSFLNIIGHNNIGSVIGKHLNSFSSNCNDPAQSISSPLQGMGSRFDLMIADQIIPFTLIDQSIIPQPFETSEHLLLFSKAEQTLEFPSINLSLDKKNQDGQYYFDRLVGQSTQLESVKVLGKKVARLPLSVLIEGESGTGKELMAEAIHLESGRKGPFVPINCGAIPKELLQSELFGYEEGTFTGGKKGGKMGKLEMADGGTLFLDEIGEMPLDMQVSLLRFLEDKMLTRMGGLTLKKVDVRVIAATNRDLMEEINNKHFRQDLYYRLNSVTIKMPSLKNRKKDLPLLISHFLNRICQELDMSVPEVDEAVIHLLSGYDWPGNCRELYNVMQSALVYSSGDKINLETMRQFFSPVKDHGVEGTTLQDIEKQTIINRLLDYEGNITKTAKSLNINRSTLYRKIKDYNIGEFANLDFEMKHA